MTCSICKKEGCTGCNSSQAMDVYARVDTLLEMCEALLNGVEIDEGWKALLRGNVNGLRGVLKEYAQLVKSAEEMQVKLGKEHTALVAAEGRTIHGYGLHVRELPRRALGEYGASGV
jgi:hypothetical protein